MPVPPVACRATESAHREPPVTSHAGPAPRWPTWIPRLSDIRQLSAPIAESALSRDLDQQARRPMRHGPDPETEASQRPNLRAVGHLRAGGFPDSCSLVLERREVR